MPPIKYSNESGWWSREQGNKNQKKLRLHTQSCSLTNSLNKFAVERTNKQTHRIAKSPCLIKRICIITNLETKIIRESAVKAFISSALSIVSVKYYCSGKFEEWHAFNYQNKVFSIGQVYVEDLPKRTIKRTFYPIEEQKCTFQRGLQVCDYMLVDSEILTLIQQVIIYLITTTERNSNKFLNIQQKTLM